MKGREFINEVRERFSVSIFGKTRWQDFKLRTVLDFNNGRGQLLAFMTQKVIMRVIAITCCLLLYSENFYFLTVFSEITEPIENQTSVECSLEDSLKS